MRQPAEEAVLRVCKSGISHFDGPDAETCWAQAVAVAEFNGDADEFEAAAKRLGLMVNCIRGARGGQPQLFRLFIPCVGRSGWDGRSK